MFRCTVGLATSLLVASCSLLFDEAGTGLPDGVEPELRFDFEEIGGDIAESSGTVPMRLQLSGVAKLEGGALDLREVGGAERGNVAATDTAHALVEACQASNEFSISLWISPGAEDFIGKAPARILSLEQDPEVPGALTNFVVAQGDNDGRAIDAVAIRTGGDGGSSFVERVGLSLPVGEPTWIGYSMKEDGGYMFFAGGTRNLGGIANSIELWKPDRTLSLGVAIGGSRPWSGLIHHVDILCTALSQAELLSLSEATDPRN